MFSLLMADPAPLLVYVAAYPHGSRRLSVGGERRVCRLPQDQWFINALESESLNLDNLAGDSARFKLMGLVQVAPGSVYCPLQFWSKHAVLQWKCFQKPLDSYTVKIIRHYPHVDPHELFLAKRMKRSGGNSFTRGGSMPISLRSDSGVIWSGDDSTKNVFRVVATGAETILDQAMVSLGISQHDLPVLLVPEPVAHLIMLGKWPELVLLWRWPLLWLLGQQGHYHAT